jgi:hypothetical protein
MKKWQWPLVKGCECKNQIFIMIELLNLCQIGTNASKCYKFELFGCWRSWLFILHSSLFLGVKLCTYVSLPVTVDSGKSFHSSLDGCTCKECGLKIFLAVLSAILWYLSSLQTVLCTFMMDNCNAVDTSL